MLSSLSKFVSFRTVSSNPLYTSDCLLGATYLTSLFKRLGATVSLLPTTTPSGAPCNPIVFARFTAPPPPPNTPNPKTILFYGHYDVIPATSEDSWATDPFVLTGLNGYLYGRGVSDNKGPVLAAIYAASELLLSRRLTADLVFLIEGEEECGSRGLFTAVRKHKHLFGTIDYVLLANSYWLDDTYPCLTYGLRGVVHAKVEISSPNTEDLHSGVDGSRLNREPTIDLVTLLSKLVDDDGSIQIPGFYDSVRPVTPSESARYTAICEAFPTQDPAQLTQRLMAKWRYPSLTIHRVDVSGPANATVIPRVAGAQISLRIVPDQGLDEIKAALVTYLQASFAKLRSANVLKVAIEHEAEWWVGAPGNKVFCVLEAAIGEVWGADANSGGTSDPETVATPADEAIGGVKVREKTVVKPLYIREGGSIPAARFLEMEFGALTAHLPCGQASDHAHLDNERLRLRNLVGCRLVLGYVFERLPWA